MREWGGGERSLATPILGGFFCSGGGGLAWLSLQPRHPSGRPFAPHLPLPPPDPSQGPPWQSRLRGKPPPVPPRRPGWGLLARGSAQNLPRGTSCEGPGWASTKPRGSREWGAVKGAGSARGLWPGMMGGVVRSSAPEGKAAFWVQTAERQGQREAGEEKRGFFANKRGKKAKKSRNRPKRKSKLTKILGTINYGGGGAGSPLRPAFLHRDWFTVAFSPNFQRRLLRLFLRHFSLQPPALDFPNIHAGPRILCGHRFGKIPGEKADNFSQKCHRRRRASKTLSRCFSWSLKSCLSRLTLT